MLDRLLRINPRKRERIRIRRGLDIAIPGAPRQTVGEQISTDTCGLMVDDYPDVHPAMAVAVGDRVAAGETLFTDRRRPEIAFTAPIAGTVTQIISRSAARAEQCVTVQHDGVETREFTLPGSAAGRDAVAATLLESGLWPAFRTRPFGRIPDPGDTPEAIFVTAMSSEPLAADAAVVIAGYGDDFAAGLELIARLTDGLVHVCQAPGPKLAENAVEFAGPHPAGLPGTHIHFLHPVGAGEVVWHLDYQDVISMGRLFQTGTPWMDRVISLAGPGVRNPQLCRVALGASLAEIAAGRIEDGDMRVISGSVLSGRTAPFFSRHHLQVSVLPEAWDAPGAGPFARPASTALEGAPGPLIPIAALDRAMPLDLLPVPLLRALSVGDRESAAQLGCLELVEEDLALLSYLCPGRGEYGPMLRAMLDEIVGES
jgi:Na+-transporting NADH:ubiquinone oxidoreductase subunit A